MSYFKKLAVGLPLELDVSEGVYEGKYRSRIEEVGEKILVVGAPIQQGEVVPLREGTKVKITFWDEVSAYSFVSKIMQRIAVPVPMFVFALPDSVTKIQRRGFVRIPVNYSFTFQMVTSEGLSDSLQGTMIDLSGGGMQFSTEEKLESNSLLYAHLVLPNGDLETPLRVIRAVKIEGSKRYAVSSEFYEITERLRDRIVRCIFDIQREMRKKGLI